MLLEVRIKVGGTVCICIKVNLVLIRYKAVGHTCNDYDKLI